LALHLLVRFSYSADSFALVIINIVLYTIHPNSNRGTENNNQNNFDANGNLLNLNNIGNLEWHHNNTLNKLTKANKSNTIQYYVYNYQGKRVQL
jgi:hypothetical protein